MYNEPNFGAPGYPQAPEPQEPTPQTPEPQKPKRHTGVKRFFSVILALVLLGAAAYGGYYYANNRDTEPANNQPSANSQTSTQTETTKKDSFHTIASQATIVGSGQTVQTQLALPNSVQSVNVPSNNQNSGFLDILINKSNDEMGNWIVGDPQLPVNAQLGTITLLRIDRAAWKALAPFDGLAEGTGAELFAARTAAAKDAALDAFAKRVKNCGGSEAKPYLLSNFFDVCTSVLVAAPQAIDTYLSFISFEGYAQKDGLEFVMLGTVRLEGLQESTVSAQKLLAKEFEQSKKPLEHSVEKAALYRDAFRRTTITITE
jgi:hypothetical protein